MISIFNKEIKTYFTSMFTYVYFMLFFCVTGIYTFDSCIGNSSTEFGFSVMNKVILVVIFFIPLCTMRLFAQEKKDRTDQMLFTAPVSNLSILLGKTLSTVTVILLPYLLSVIFPIVMSVYGTVSVRYIASAYIACISISIIFVMLGILVSVLAPNGILSAVITYAIYAVILVLRVVEGSVKSESLMRVISDYSFYNRLNDMISGVIRTKDLCFLISSMFLFFILAWICLYVRKDGWKKNIVKAVCIIAVFVGVILIGNSTNKVYDFTADQVLTLSQETQYKVNAITKETTIYYLGKESRANITYKELLNCYAQLSDNIVIKYEELSDDSTIVQTYLNALGSISEASLLIITDDRYTFLNSKDYISEVYTSTYTTKKLLNIENLLTSAICYVNSDIEEKIINIEGAGEDNLTSSFRNGIMLNNYSFKTVNFEEEANRLQSVFEDDYKLAFINAPDQDYSETEIALLKRYLSHGGNIFVTIDPINEDVPNLYAFLAEYGLNVQPGIVYETEQEHCMYSTPYYVIPLAERNRFTESFLNDKAQVITMTSKGIICRDTANGYVASDVLVTTKDAFSKVENFDNSSIEKGENDIGGPLAVAAVSEKSGEGSIFLLASNVFFNDEVDDQSNGANRKFLINIFNQLCGKTDVTDIEKKEVGTQTAFYPMSFKGIMKWILIVVIPAICLLAGVAVVVIRNKNLLVRSNNGGKSDEEVTQEK